MRKIIICLVTILNSVVLNAQIPTSIDLKEEGAYQRRDLSTIGSRIVINPYDFGKSPQENTAVVYSNSEVLPLNVAYLTAQNVYHEKERRFGREFKNVLEIRVASCLESPDNGVEKYSTEWAPHALMFSADYKDGSHLEGHDFFYDDNTIVRSLRLDKKEHYLLSGFIKGEVRLDDRNETLIVYSGNCKYAVSVKGMNSKNVSFYVSGEDMKARTNKVADTGDARWWALDMKGKGDVNIAVAYALNTDSDAMLISNVRRPFKKNIDDVYLDKIRYWDDFLKNKIPHPVNFELTSIDKKGITAEQIKKAYYKAWVLLAQNVLEPETENYPYYQVVTGKASLWDEGHELAPFSAAWESFVAIQLFAYIDVNISWSSLKGLLALVDESGMLGGESLPSRKAHTAWVLYELSKDAKSLSEVYPAISRYLNWRLQNPRWIYTNMTPENEKDAEFVVSAIKDVEYMILLAKELGLEEDAEEWRIKKESFVEQYKQWFWSTPQDLPCQHINQYKGRDTHPIQITTGLYVNEIDMDYYESLLGLFYKHYDTNQSFAGFNAPKYPDVDFTLYGLIERGKDVLARGLLESNLRDILRADCVYAETYTNDAEPQPGGVRPSIFGLAAMIDFTLLKNGYMFTKGTPTAINIYPESTIGVTHIPYLGKYIDINKKKQGDIIFSGSAMQKIKSLKLEKGEMGKIVDN
jgi:hypothetical protein